MFIHAGDFTSSGELRDIARFNVFLATLPHRHKIVVAGNHDFAFERNPDLARSMLTNAVYLQDSEVTIDDVRIYGSPWQPRFMNWAFNLERGPQLKAKWDRIPEGIHVLVTHGPPRGCGDAVPQFAGPPELVGCEDLLEAVRRIKPRYHVFGHIHEGYGVTKNGEVAGSSPARRSYFLPARRTSHSSSLKPTAPPVSVRTKGRFTRFPFLESSSRACSAVSFGSFAFMSKAL